MERTIRTLTTIRSRVSLTALALGALAASNASAHDDDHPFPHHGVELLSWLALDEFGPDVESGNDCWGYVSPSGREYALMGLNNALAVVEITNPTAPAIIAQIPHPNSLWADVKVFGAHAFVVNESGGGVQVIDLTGVDGGVVQLVGEFFADEIPTSHNIVINEESGFAYLCGSDVPGRGLVAVDVSNPTDPTVAGHWAEGVYVHDAQILTYHDGPYAGREIAFCASGTDGLVILDVTDKSDIVELSSLAYPGLGYAHQSWLDDERRYLYMNDELDELLELVETSTTHVIDVSEPTAPQHAGKFTNGVVAIDHNLYLRGGIIYQANYTSGLRVFDARDPADALNPPEVGFFDTHPPTDEGPEHPDHPDDQGELAFRGAWSVFPFFPSGVVIVSDLDRGLFVLDPSEAIATPNPADFNGDGAVDGADLAILLTQFGFAADGQAADLNEDGVIDGADIAILLANWTG